MHAHVQGATQANLGALAQVNGLVTSDELGI